MPVARIDIPLQQSNQLDLATRHIKNCESPLFILTAYAIGRVRSFRSTNPVRITTIAKKYCKDGYPCNIQVWVRVGEDYMIPLNYNATSERDLSKITLEMSKDISTAESVMKGGDKNDKSV